jgi:hypothetical protein
LIRNCAKRKACGIADGPERGGKSLQTHTD